MIIYKATNKINGKAYIGQTVGSLKKRKRQHINDVLAEKDNFYFYNTIRKYGIDNFDWEIIAEGECSIETLNKLEIHFIQLYDTFNNGYNLTLGGGGNKGYILSKKVKEKISESRKGKCIGKDHPMWGRKHSKETRQKISESLKGKHLLEETKKKISESLKGRRNGKDNPMAKAVIINNRYFDTRDEAAEFMDVVPSTIRYRILHKTKWLDYKYASKGES